MKIRFTHDFRGAYTGERFYLEGEEAEIHDAAALLLIQDKHAVRVAPEPPPAPPPAAEPEPEKPKKKAAPKKPAKKKPSRSKGKG